MKLYLVRHGESQANIDQFFANRSTKHPLTAKGLEQVRRKTEELKSIKFAKVYSSPLVRAIQAATIIASSQGLDVQIAESLREYDVGVFEGTSSKSHEQGAILHSCMVNDWKNGNKSVRLPGGECLLDVEYRLKSFIDVLFNAMNENENILCLGHGGLFGSALPGIVENIDPKLPDQIPLDYLSSIIIEKKNSKIYCTNWCGKEIGNT